MVKPFFCRPVSSPVIRPGRRNHVSLLLALLFCSIPAVLFPSAKPLQTVIVDNYEPYSFVNEQGSPAGFSVDLLKAVARVMDLAVEIKVDSWGRAQEELAAGRIDLLPMMAFSRERDARFDFSVAHTIAYDAFFVRKGAKRISAFGELAGKGVIVLRGDVAHEFLLSAAQGGRHRIIPAESLPDALRMLAAGQGETAVMPKLVGLLLIGRLDLSNIDPAPSVIEAYTRPFSFAVREGDQALLERLNQGLTIVKATGEYGKIYRKWFGALEKPETHLKDVLYYLIVIIAIITLTGLVFLVWSISLRKTVARRTHELEAEIDERQRVEARLSRAQEIAHLGSWEYDAATGKIIWSDEAYRIFGLNPGEGPITKDRIRGMIHPEDWSPVERAFGDQQDGYGPHDIGYRIIRGDGTVRFLQSRQTLSGKGAGTTRIFGMVQDITERKQAEDERETTIKLLGIQNSDNGLLDLMKAISIFLHDWSGCEAVGIRLRDGDDFPYYETRGFPADFVEIENRLCARDIDGQVKRDETGHPLLECMCGNILCGRFDPSKPFFTEHGSFWSNCTTELLATTTEADRQARTRNRCNGEGYESVALIPLKQGKTTFGLIQLNDKRPGRFTLELLAQMERMADSIAISMVQRQARQQLRLKEQQLSRVMETSPVGITQVDADGTIILANLQAEQVLGLTKKQILQRTYNTPVWKITDFKGNPLPDDSLPFMKVKETRQPVYDIQHVIEWPNGMRRYLSINATPLLTETGQFEGMVAAISDITERKHAEEMLQEQLIFLQQLLDAIPIPIFYKDLQGVFRGCNTAYEQFAGMTKEQIVGKTVFGVAPEDLANIYRQADEALFTQPGTQVYETSFMHADGDRRDIIFNKATYVDSDGRLAGLVGAILDITARHRAEQEKRNLEKRLHRAEKMEALGQLAGGVAHDLNNVLGVSTIYSELLQEKIPEESPLRKFVDNILTSTKKGAAIIEDLLTLARRGVTVANVMNLNSIISTFLKAPEYEKIQAYHPHVTFRTECQGGLLNIKGSPIHIEKTLLNLVSNAAESISGTGEVTIRTENRYLDRPIRGYDEVKEGDYAVLTVSDTGMGIPAESIGKIFEPFYTKKIMGRSGTGLGLAIVWGTVKDHKGYIDLSTEVGEGTAFTLYFPVTREELITPQQKTPIERYMGKGESVLVVDDIVEQRDVASRLLTRLGYRVHAVASGEEAVEYLKVNTTDILVLDMIMEPGIDGLETFRRVLEINPQQKAIIVSGFAETERVTKVQEMGAGAYVRKPYVMEKIGIALREELSKQAPSAR